MTQANKVSFAIVLIMGLGVAGLGYLGAKYHPEAPKNEREVPYDGQTTEIGIETLLDAIMAVESGGDPDAIGDGGRAIGAYQIWKIYVDDANRILALQGKSKRYTYEDRWDKAKSREMTSIVIQHYGNDIETMARTHKCPPKRYSESTKPYWEKVKRALERE